MAEQGTTPVKTNVAENAGKQPAPAGTTAAQRAESHDKAQAAADQQLAIAGAQEKTRAANAQAEKDAIAAEGGSPSGTVSAKETQPKATPVDTGKMPKKAESISGPAGIGANDKLADLTPPERAKTNVPTQDPPINVDARVPVGSSRVDLTRSDQGIDAGGRLQGQPMGHLGSGGGVPPEPTHRNPPVRRG